MAYIYLFGQPMQLQQAQCGKERNCKISFENCCMRSHTHCACCCWTEHIHFAASAGGGGRGLPIHIRYMCCALCWPIKKVHVVTLTNNLADAFGHLAKAKAKAASTFSIFMACLSLPWHVFSSTHIPHNSYTCVCVWYIFFNLLKGHVRGHAC